MAANSHPQWAQLQEEAQRIEGTHLRDLLQDEARCGAMTAEHDGMFLDYSRQRATLQTMDLLFDLAAAQDVSGRVAAMAGGEHINVTEDRAVMHHALRAPADATLTVDGENVVPGVHEVLNRIADFSERVRSGAFKGAKKKKLTDVVSIGIGGSYLGPEFVYEALRTDPEAAAAADGRRLRFLANVDPVDVTRALEGLNAETTLVIIVSKTFTTAETMLNARTVRKWLTDNIRANEDAVIRSHMVAVSANVAGAQAFGIAAENVFGFWDWVGGRYSVCSAVGMLPLALQYGFPVVQQFLAGAHSMDEHFKSAPPRENLPLLLAVLGVWNANFLGHAAHAVLPYSQALLRFPAHIQQLEMESNGKRVAVDGSLLPYPTGEIFFGEPGTNGQHSFYQLVHQGRTCPATFIGAVASQTPMELDGEPVSNHDALMANFFAQADALAVGKSLQDLEAEGVPAELRPHKEFPGNRPSVSLLLPAVNAYYVGALLALFENRVAAAGFIWGLPSFDQFGVELGKVLARNVQAQLSESRKRNAEVAGFNPSTTAMMKRYLGQPPSPPAAGAS